mgnify:CR=1 FL=1
MWTVILKTIVYAKRNSSISYSIGTEVRHYARTIFKIFLYIETVSWLFLEGSDTYDLWFIVWKRNKNVYYMQREIFKLVERNWVKLKCHHKEIEKNGWKVSIFLPHITRRYTLNSRLMIEWIGFLLLYRVSFIYLNILILEHFDINLLFNSLPKIAQVIINLKNKVSTDKNLKYW